MYVGTTYPSVIFVLIYIMYEYLYVRRADGTLFYQNTTMGDGCETHTNRRLCEFTFFHVVYLCLSYIACFTCLSKI